MNRKIILSIAALLLLIMPSQAQGLIDMGVKAGLSSQNFRYSNKTKYDSYKVDSDSKAGFHIGIISRINLPLFHIQPEILFSHNSYTLRVRDNFGGLTSSSKVRINTVDVPVLAGLRLLWFRFQAGPMFTVMTDTKLKNNTYANDLLMDMPTVSYLLGLGFDIGRLNLDVRYNGQFKRPEQSIYFAGDKGVNYRNRVGTWNFSVGYLF